MFWTLLESGRVKRMLRGRFWCLVCVNQTIHCWVMAVQLWFLGFRLLEAQNVLWTISGCKKKFQQQWWLLCGNQDLGVKIWSGCPYCLRCGSHNSHGSSSAPRASQNPGKTFTGKLGSGESLGATVNISRLVCQECGTQQGWQCLVLIFLCCPESSGIFTLQRVFPGKCAQAYFSWLLVWIGWRIIATTRDLAHFFSSGARLWAGHWDNSFWQPIQSHRWVDQELKLWNLWFAHKLCLFHLLFRCFSHGEKIHPFLWWTCNCLLCVPCYDHQTSHHAPAECFGTAWSQSWRMVTSRFTCMALKMTSNGTAFALFCPLAETLRCAQWVPWGFTWQGLCYKPRLANTRAMTDRCLWLSRRPSAPCMPRRLVSCCLPPYPRQACVQPSSSQRTFGATVAISAGTNPDQVQSVGHWMHRDTFLKHYVHSRPDPELSNRILGSLWSEH